MNDRDVTLILSYEYVAGCGDAVISNIENLSTCFDAFTPVQSFSGAGGSLQFKPSKQANTYNVLEAIGAMASTNRNP